MQNLEKYKFANFIKCISYGRANNEPKHTTLPRKFYDRSVIPAYKRHSLDLIFKIIMEIQV